MKKTITTCVWAGLAALLISACGGKDFLGEQNGALEGADASAETPTDENATDDTTSTSDDADDAVDDATPTSDDADPVNPADDGEPGASDDSNPGTEPSDPDPTDPDPTDPTDDDTSEPGADDPADPNDPTDPSEVDAGPGVEPDPTDPEYDACADKVCGESCNSCPPNALCLSAPGYCSAEGECSPEVPMCEPTKDECPTACPAPAICQFCDDGETCASPVFECNADGTCAGIAEWLCPEPEPEPDPNSCPESCPVIEICQLCDDGSCAAANVACNPDGTCGDVTWECPSLDVGCEVAADCGEYTGDAPCLDCSQDPEAEPGAVGGCPKYVCVEKACELKFPTCTYDPCDGKEDGDSCQLCAPEDPSCGEIAVSKVCTSGKCDTAVETN
jgi:hypothetical protein